MRTCKKCGSTEIAIRYIKENFKFRTDVYRETNLNEFNTKKYSEHTTWYECKEELLSCVCTECEFRWFTKTEDNKTRNEK